MVCVAVRRTNRFYLIINVFIILFNKNYFIIYYYIIIFIMLKLI